MPATGLSSAVCVGGRGWFLCRKPAEALLCTRVSYHPVILSWEVWEHPILFPWKALKFWIRVLAGLGLLKVERGFGGICQQNGSVSKGTYH